MPWSCEGPAPAGPSPLLSPPGRGKRAVPRAPGRRQQLLRRDPPAREGGRRAHSPRCPGRLARLRLLRAVRPRAVLRRLGGSQGRRQGRLRTLPRPRHLPSRSTGHRRAIRRLGWARRRRARPSRPPAPGGLTPPPQPSPHSAAGASWSLPEEVPMPASRSLAIAYAAAQRAAAADGSADLLVAVTADGDRVVVVPTGAAEVIEPAALDALPAELIAGHAEVLAQNAIRALVDDAREA